jgi:hypothetical protein
VTRVFRFLTVVIALLGAGNARGADVPLQIEAEHTTTVHVGQLAVLQVPADPLYAPSEINGAWRDVLTRIRRSGRTVTFRAVRAGSGVIILSPNVPDGECISCRTLHYFIRVVPAT